MGFITSDWVCKVWLVDTSTERETRSLWLEARAPRDYGRPEEHIASVAFDLRKRFEQQPLSDVQNFEVEIVCTETHTREPKSFRECDKHAAIVHPEHGCPICEDIAYTERRRAEESR